MSVEHKIKVQPNTCVLLAPADVSVGTHVTDAVRTGGWTLARTTSALDAMLMLCRLEQAQREAGRSGQVKHMLLIHRDLGEAVIADLTLAVRTHLHAVKVHEIEVQAGEPEAAENAVVGRIGRTVSAAALASKALERSASVHAEHVEDVEHDADDADEHDAGAAQDHEVTRDEIAMLLSDETGLEPRTKHSAETRLPGAEDGR